jgi:hypothetical protein
MSSSERMRASIVVSDYVRAAIVYFLENSKYRNEFVKDPLKAIDTYRGDLGFSSEELPQAAKDFLKSLTPEDVENLKKLYDKFQQYGLENVCEGL